MRYRAFICYSQTDKGAAARLHRAIESYRVPSRLVGKSTAVGPVPLRLSPIFRDCDELAACSDIAAHLREALQRSEFLIVLCSPAAAQSRWVNEEIEIFRRARPENASRILCAIVSGEPNSGEPVTECFPAALRTCNAGGSAAALFQHLPTWSVCCTSAGAAQAT